MNALKVWIVQRVGVRALLAQSVYFHVSENRARSCSLHSYVTYRYTLTYANRSKETHEQGVWFKSERMRRPSDEQRASESSTPGLLKRTSWRTASSLCPSHPLLSAWCAASRWRWLPRERHTDTHTGVSGRPTHGHQRKGKKHKHGPLCCTLALMKHHLPLSLGAISCAFFKSVWR